MAKKKSLHRHTLTVHYPGLPKPISFSIPMSDATQAVTLTREQIDAFNGKPGVGIECMNAHCALRQRDLFPHEAYMIEFIDTRAYVVDKLTAQGFPAHCIRYYHHEGDEQKEFDAPGGKQKLIQSGRVKKTITLLAPTKSTKHIPNPNPRPRMEGERKSHKRHGSFARFLRSKQGEAAA
jgi:hypothetical protein